MKFTAQSALALAIASALVPAAHATDFDVKIQNLTRGSYFTPLLAAAHVESAMLFTSGEAASTALQAMAEGGSLDGLQGVLDSIGGTYETTDGLTAPGDKTTVISLNTDAAPANVKLSIVGMILPSNDGFIGLNSIDIPTTAGTYTYYVNAYDAGTEANDELRGSGASGMPGMPVPGPLDSSVGNGGSGLSGDAEGFVHIHRGVLGDTDSTGGASDIDSTQHRWLNPVARVVVTVK